MVLEASPDSPAFVRIATSAILYLHIAAGGLGIASGAAALVIRKGGPLHRIVGNVFFVSMLIMAAIGAAVSPFLPKPQWVNVFMGVFTCFLVLTSRATIRRKEGSIGTLDRGAFVFATLMTLAALVFGVAVALSPTRSIDDFTIRSAAVLTTLWASVAVAERRMITRGGVFGAQRVIRHLWRMCVALLIAVVSLFLGQAKMFPADVQGTGLLFVPAFAVMAAIGYWLFRMRRSKHWRAASSI
jgi:hypothetical protein